MNIFNLALYDTFENLLDLSNYKSNEPIDLLDLLKVAKQNPEVSYTSICRNVCSNLPLNSDFETSIRGRASLSLTPTTNFVDKFPIILKAIPSLKTKYI